MIPAVLSAACLLPAQEPSPPMRPSEVITVETSRLRGQTSDRERAPQAVVVITSEEIRRSAARTVAELLASRPEVVFYDPVGNGREAAVDLRGFNEGTAAAVFLDDVRINEPEDNRVLLTQVPLEWVDRIEIVKGSTSSVLGGGALSGAVRIYTRQPQPGGSIALRGGSFGEAGLRGEVCRDAGPGSIRFDGGYSRSNGFRENGGAREDWFRSSWSRSTAASFLSAGYSFTGTRFGSPGALLKKELQQDRWRAPYNLVDENRDRTHLASVDLHWSIGGAQVAANSFVRQNAAQSLTTGRYAALFGGFATDARSTSGGSTTQVSAPLFDGHATITTGAELTWVGLGAEGYYTDASGKHAGQASATHTNENGQGLFAQVEGAFAERITIELGLRYDRQALHFDDRMTGSASSRTFARGTYKTGASYRWRKGATAFVNVSSAFQMPTIGDLFAYPLFGSNADLKPSVAHSIEAGQRFQHSIFAFEFSAYRLRVEDEVVFVLTDPIHFIGRNENAGRSSRSGIDVSLQASPVAFATMRLSYSYIRAKFEAGDYTGGFLTMVPRNKLSASVSYKPADGFDITGDLLYTGSQFVQGDEANALPPLPSYWTAGLRGEYQRGRWSLGCAIRNLLDREYSTRAITNGFDTYYTPAAGINADVTMTYAF